MMAQCIESLRKLFTFARKSLKQPHPPIFLPLVTEAWVSIGTNRVRAMLAMLGIIIGVGSVVLMVAVGSGSQKKVEKAINSLGTNLLIIVRGGSQQRGLRLNSQPAIFTDYDISSIAQLPSVEAVAFTTNQASETITSSFGSTKTTILGTVAEYLPIRNWVLGDGNSFTTEDIRLGKRVAIIGATVAQKLFLDQNALGQTVSIGKSNLGFLVIGVLQAKESRAGRQRPGRYRLYAPYHVQNLFLSLLPLRHRYRLC